MLCVWIFFVDLHSPFPGPVFNAMQMVLEIEGGRCRMGVSRNYSFLHEWNIDLLGLFPNI